jgi:agmatinase
MNFLGLTGDRAEASRARAAVLPVPYERTTSYGRGARLGPAAIIAASAKVEHYDEVLGRSPAAEFAIATLPELRPRSDDPEAAVEEIARGVAGALKPGRLLLVLGGEHALSAGVIRPVAEAARAAREKLCAVVLDAHSDLRDSFGGTRYSHACASRRISEHCPVLEIGIRSLSDECAEFLAGEGKLRAGVVFAHEIPPGEIPAKRISDFCRGRSVYLSVDIDVLDPSEMPSTGTPEPGGLSWRQVIAVVDEVARAGEGFACMDLVELAPLEGLRAPDFLAARLAYRMIAAGVLGPAVPDKKGGARRRGRRSR